MASVSWHRQRRTPRAPPPMAYTELRWVLHGLRLTAAGVVSGIVAGAVAGLGSRGAMLVIRWMNPSHNGAMTHAGAEIGVITAEGTFSLVAEGMFHGFGGGLFYLLVRRWMPGTGLRKALTFGAFLLVVGGGAVLDGNYEYFRYVSTWVSVGLFALLYPLFGLVASPLTERLGHGRAGPPAHRVVAWTGYFAVAALATWSIVRGFVALRDVFHLYG
jgi:hypothetical protein